MNYNKRCPHRVILKNFDWHIKLCKLQNCEPVFCPEVKEDCHVYIEYNSDTSAHYPNKGNDIVRTYIKNEV